MSEWISVNDDLPQNGVYVLALERVPNPSSYLSIDLIPWVFQARFYRSNGWEVKYKQDAPIVTHWMPLPAPPKENE